MAIECKLRPSHTEKKQKQPILYRLLKQHKKKDRANTVTGIFGYMRIGWSDAPLNAASIAGRSISVFAIIDVGFFMASS